MTQYLNFAYYLLWKFFISSFQPTNWVTEKAEGKFSRKRKTATLKKTK